MSKIQADKLIARFKRMALEHWRYEWGAAREGVVDCSGAFVEAFEALGGPKMPHGSNAIVRERAGEIAPAAQARPGYIVTKWRADFTGADAEKLLKKYGKDGLGNHHHIGLMGDDGLVYNAQSEATGFVASKLKGWNYCFPLKDVVYDEEAESVATLYRATVATRDDPLNVRDAPRTGKKIGVVPRGATVEVLSDGDWPRIRFGELVGYASAEFLTRVEETENETDDGETETDGGETVAVPREALLALGDALGNMKDVSPFSQWAQNVSNLETAAEAVCAYLKGDD